MKTQDSNINFSVSILLPVINETFSLKQTINVIEEANNRYIEEFIIVYCKKTTDESWKVINELMDIYDNKIILLEQKLPYLGGAMRDAFEICKGTHVIIMASDLETDPVLVKQFIEEALNAPDMIITATRWKGGQFKGYNPLKLVLNYVFQKLFSLLYGVNLTDMTYGFRILPVKLVNSIRWEELRHPFLFETLLKPLKLGVRVKELPTKWNARLEGNSQNTFFRNFAYFKIGIKVRFMNISQIK
ncbi:MAG: glycosyltransferase family 2 protein [Bacteroidales bacterium]|nr:glycosyltransferase family 2 protein [Bacteroidales bacterium]